MLTSLDGHDITAATAGGEETAPSTWMRAAAIVRERLAAISEPVASS